MKNNKPKISVIIPLYNCEKYLNKCLDSLKDQTFKDFEAIIVNNGSTDNSGNIARTFTENDSRFVIINHKSGSAGEARNVGIKASKGAYLAFLDADDSLDGKFLETLYAQATKYNADIVNSGFYFYFLNTNKTKKCGKLPKNDCYDRDQAMKYLLKDTKIRFYLWNKLWKKSLFTDSNIKIPNMYYEDAAVCPQLFFYAKKVVSTDYCGYYYTRAFSKHKEVNMPVQRINDYINTVPVIRLFLEEKGCYKKFKSCFRKHIFRVFFSVPILAVQARKNCQNGIFKNMIKGMSAVAKYSLTSYDKLQKIDFTKNALK